MSTEDKNELEPQAVQVGHIGDALKAPKKPSKPKRPTKAELAERREICRHQTAMRNAVAAAVFGNLVAKAWDPDDLFEGHINEAHIPDEVLAKAAEEAKRAVPFFVEEFGLEECEE